MVYLHAGFLSRRAFSLDAVLSCYVERMTRTGGHKTKACTGC